MKEQEQLIGKIFGSRQITGIFKKNSQIMCHVICKCGDIGITRLSFLKAGKAIQCKKCGRKVCANKLKKTLPIGYKSGKWTIIDVIQQNVGKTKTIIQCECGYIKKTNISYIHSSNMCNKCKGKQQIGIPSKSRKGYMDISGTYWTALKAGAKARNYDFTITLKDCWELYLKQNKKCNLSGLDIILGFFNDSSQTASIDRIDNSKGYIEENVQWVHKDINNMKHTFTEEYFIKLCKEVAKHKNK